MVTISALRLSQGQEGVPIAIDESSSRAIISRYGLGTNEPPAKTARLVTKALRVPLAYLYCDEDDVAGLLMELTTKSTAQRRALVSQWRQGLR